VVVGQLGAEILLTHAVKAVTSEDVMEFVSGCTACEMVERRHTSCTCAMCVHAYTDLTT
jgi:hypothetical protein